MTYRSTMSGQALWDRLEVLARQKLGLGPEYRLCGAECLPHDDPHHRDSGFEKVRVHIGEPLTRANGIITWVDVRRCTIPAEAIDGKVRDNA
mgnify:CR=1 FL=1